VASFGERGLQGSKVAVGDKPFLNEGALRGGKEARQDREPIVRRGDRELATLGDELPTEALAEEPVIASDRRTARSSARG
jgi:hypothetical protein